MAKILLMNDEDDEFLTLHGLKFTPDMPELNSVVVHYEKQNSFVIGEYLKYSEEVICELWERRRKYKVNEYPWMEIPLDFSQWANYQIWKKKACSKDLVIG